MPFIDIHPAPGLGEMLPGWFVVPNNPFAPPQPIGMGTGVGMILPAAASQNARNVLLDIAQTVGRAPGERGKDPVVIHGLGAFEASDLNPQNWDLPTWIFIAGAGLFLLATMRRGRLEYKAAKHAAKARYYEALSEAKKQHPTLTASAYRAMRS